MTVPTAPTTSHVAPPTRISRLTVRLLWLALAKKDPATALHCRRVGRLAAQIGRELGLPRGEVRTLLQAGWLHDIGKFAVPAAILSKTGPLNEAERTLIEGHVRAGCRIVGSFPALRHLLPAISGHHRRLDGSGYPATQAGEPVVDLGARVLAVADTWDALVTDRPYRPAMPRLEAEEILRDGAGHLYDPDVVGALFDVVS